MGGRRDSGIHTPNAPCSLHLCTLARLAPEQGPPERPRQIAPRSQPGLSTALWPIRPRACRASSMRPRRYPGPNTPKAFTACAATDAHGTAAHGL
ncbi:predicted protein [Pyrenophora tritici-repentis Pt-1C-BFP]|uniref:Uncharacterized protein n=1 Tax=Pyrenophora tritici-repentis (strain Pt-1C-BFP) TaxID=426418 RepID=B2W9W3_PYRTR|nr:uncharacterized protein PTRG_06771 [Pyrenophora tritici-repentis Pt-1C-BFP]EDU49691.1 predicted protein [Pyrenophora tritici-repentis Pt-1C-BFP]